MRLRTALVTARSAPAHERAIRTLMDWHIHVDEAMFLGGLAKGPFLREFEPISISTTRRGTSNRRRARAVGPRPHGIANEAPALDAAPRKERIDEAAQCDAPPACSALRSRRSPSPRMRRTSRRSA
jgi:5'-nucleotidase